MRKFAGPQLEVVIVSDDKDMFQLVGEQVKVFSARKEKILGPAEVKDMLGVGPELVTDYIGLAGDSSDNIPGVQGIGEVTARKLLSEYGRLEDIFKNVDGVKPARVGILLTEQKEQAVFSRELATLDGQVPVNISLADLRIPPLIPNGYLSFLRSWSLIVSPRNLSMNCRTSRTWR